MSKVGNLPDDVVETNISAMMKRTTKNANSIRVERSGNSFNVLRGPFDAAEIVATFPTEQAAERRAKELLGFETDVPPTQEEP